MTFGVGIASSPFWFDELVSVSVAARSVGGIADILHRQDLNMGLYYLLLHVWTQAGGSEAWVRGLSVIPAVATVLVTAILARRLFGDAVGVISGLFVVGNGFVVSNAQNARSYALGMLLITLATLLFVEAIERPRTRMLFAYGAVSVLAVYATPLAGLVLLAHVASLPFLPDAGKRKRSLGLTYGAIVLAVAPLAVLMSIVGPGQVGYLERPRARALQDAVFDVIGAPDSHLLQVAYVTLIAIGLLATWRAWRCGGDGGETWRWKRLLVIGWLILPTGLLFVFSQALPLFLSRYLLGCAPAAAIMAAVGLVSVARRSRALSVATAVIVFCLALQARVDLKPNGGRSMQYSDAAARVIAIQSRPGDGIVYPAPYTRLFHYYLDREAGPDVDPPTDFAIPPSDRGQLTFYAKELSPNARARRLLDYRRVWLVQWNWSGIRGAALPTLELLRTKYREVSRSAYGGGLGTSVELYERKKDPAR